ncbi:hypothetical protein DAT35_16900 [Vitiosangium sp. GDMCC 1.1324]|nr:hypothetical protein DAT35_16900 [Vitiosangium sp. GDMCC 1.1324]
MCVGLIACGAPGGGPGTDEGREALHAHVSRIEEEPGAPRWSWYAGGPDDAELNRVAHDRDGSIVALGNFEDFLTPRPGDTGGPITGTGQRSLLVARFSPEGRRLWTRVFNATSTESVTGEVFSSALALDGAGNIYIAGFHEGVLDFGHGPIPSGAFLVKLDCTGRPLWSTGLLGSGDLQFERLLVDEGELIAAGTVSGTVDLGGGPLTAPDRRGVLAKFTTGGALRWALLDPEGRDSYLGLAVDTDENLYVSGADAFPAPPFLLKVSPKGTILWSRSLVGATGELRDVAVCGDRVVIAGSIQGSFIFRGQTIPSPFGGVVAAYTRKGQERWAKIVGTNAHSVATDGRGGVVLGGNYRPGDDLGRGPEAGDPAGNNLYVAKFDYGDGALRWVRTFLSDGAFAIDLAVRKDGSSTAVGAFMSHVDLGEGRIDYPSSYDHPFILELAP